MRSARDTNDTTDDRDEQQNVTESGGISAGADTADRPPADAEQSAADSDDQSLDRIDSGRTIEATR